MENMDWQNESDMKAIDKNVKRSHTFVICYLFIKTIYKS